MKIKKISNLNLADIFIHIKYSQNCKTGRDSDGCKMKKNW
jgi:hypothetical protein